MSRSIDFDDEFFKRIEAAAKKWEYKDAEHYIREILESALHTDEADSPEEHLAAQEERERKPGYWGITEI